MNVQRGKLVSGGRIQIPAEIRKQLALTDGDPVQFEVVDGELRVRPMREVIRRVQERMKRYIPIGISLADELIADRRREAADE